MVPEIIHLLNREIARTLETRQAHLEEGTSTPSSATHFVHISAVERAGLNGLNKGQKNYL